MKEIELLNKTKITITMFTKLSTKSKYYTDIASLENKIQEQYSNEVIILIERDSETDEVVIYATYNLKSNISSNDILIRMQVVLNEIN